MFQPWQILLCKEATKSIKRKVFGFFHFNSADSFVSFADLPCNSEKSSVCDDYFLLLVIFMLWCLWWYYYLVLYKPLLITQTNNYRNNYDCRYFIFGDNWTKYFLCFSYCEENKRRVRGSLSLDGRRRKKTDKRWNLFLSKELARGSVQFSLFCVEVKTTFKHF